VFSRLVLRYLSDVGSRKMENAGTDHANPSTKKVVVVSIAMMNRMLGDSKNAYSYCGPHGKHS
jgi:hypothetical protein